MLPSGHHAQSGIFHRRWTAPPCPGHTAKPTEVQRLQRTEAKGNVATGQAGTHVIF